MKQVLNSLQNGSILLDEVPCPAIDKGHLLVRTSKSLISLGTERMLVDFGKAGWLGKARQQPEKLRMVVDKIRTDGLSPTLAAMRSKLDRPLPMGYCNAGQVVAVGDGVMGFAVGDRVASNGHHSEIVAVPEKLCAKVPHQVSDEDAAFTPLGAIALQGIRLVGPSLGETIVVTGLGLIGLITVQLLRAQGCRVLGIDTDSSRLSLARGFGAEVVELGAGQDPVIAARAFSRGRGVDAVIITAATRSSEPVHQAALMSRKRGRIVLVGVTGLELSRADFYEKELTFQVSCSYGPGRYDANYEVKGQDYPIGFVRWTEQRNFEAVLDMLNERRLDVQSLVSHRFAIEEATKAYDVVAGSEPSLGIILTYRDANTQAATGRTIQVSPALRATSERVVAGFIGAGNYASSVLVPAFRASGARLRSVASLSGVSSAHLARKFGVEQATTDPEELLADKSISVAVVSTRHNSHASLVLAALAAGKHVFVEKPLCLTRDELSRIRGARNGLSPKLMVGFNRRFAPLVQRMKLFLAATPEPKAFVITINAGEIPVLHWTQDTEIGGGRLLGEGCHFIDLLRYLAGSPILTHTATYMTSATRDSATVTLKFADGSIGTIHYFANGSKAFPKERIEAFSSGRILQLDNFRRLIGFGWPGFRRAGLWRQDKGQRACVLAFVEAVSSGGESPIPFEELVEVTEASIAISQQVPA